MQLSRSAITWAGSVLLIFFILYRLLYRPVREFLNKRAERINNELQDASDKMKTAQDLRAEYEQKIRDIELERGAILDEARKQANDKRNELLTETKSELETLKERASLEMVAERERVKDQIHQAIVDISSDMAAKLITMTIDQKTQDKLFDEAMAELETMVFKG